MDEMPGDRLSTCGGPMMPVGITFYSKKGYQIRHRCVLCGYERVNRIAENTVQPDNLDAILSVMAKES
jgi:hypothetical protein